MRGQLELKTDITFEEAQQRIHAAIEQHTNAVRLHRSTISALESVIRGLKADSLVHQSYIRALNSQHNGYIPISRLPPEVLCHIFSFSQRSKYGDMLPYSDWTGLTHVCRYWRDVSINFPSLWTELHFGNDQWLSEAVRRSRNAGLVFNIAGSSREHQRGLECALQYRLRIRGLRVLDSPELDVWNRIQYALARSPARLEFLNLTAVSDAQYEMTFQQLQTFPSTEKDVLRNMMCQLRNLRLVQCYVDWELPLVFQPAVTHLTLEALTSQPTWRQFIFAMKQMPYLEYLSLESKDLIADQTSTSIPPLWAPQDRIHFAHLHTLNILSEAPLETETFFRLITFPPSAIVSIECFAEHPSSTDFSKIMMSLIRFYSIRLFDPHFQTVAITRYHYAERRRGGTWLMFSTSTYPDLKLICGNLPDANLQLDFHWETQSSVWDSVRLDVKQQLNVLFTGPSPLQHIRHIYLDFDDDNDIDAEILLTTVGKLVELDTVITGMHASKPFLDAMEQSLVAQDPAPVGSVAPFYFPKLSSISFEGARITNSKSAPNPIAVQVERLQDCLIRRYKCGAEIPHVYFVGCHGLGRQETMYSMKESLLEAVREAKRIYSQLPALE